jgi:hypothetical protein
MRFAFHARQATLVRVACILAVAGSMVACDSSTGTNYPNELTVAGGDAQSVALNTSAGTQLSVVVKDDFGNLVHNAQVLWTVDSGSGTLAAPMTKTSVDGVAVNTFTGGATKGDAVITATVGGIYVVQFTEHVGS